MYESFTLFADDGLWLRATTIIRRARRVIFVVTYDLLFNPYELWRTVARGGCGAEAPPLAARPKAEE